MERGVIVVGAGIIGLTTAVVLAEAGTPVRVWSRDPVEMTTSAAAGALWEPYRVEPQELVFDWSRRSFRVLEELAAKPDETGVRMADGIQAHPEGEGPPFWAATVPGMRRATADELPPGCASGYRARMPLVDMPTHLGHLTRRLAAAGGELEPRAITSFDEPAAEAGVVVNCTGLGARELVPDPGVRPVQGQIVVVENPGLTEWFVDPGGEGEDALYALPQPFGVVLGGTAREDEWGTEPDPEIAAGIVRRVCRLDPRLAQARVLGHRVGLRPYRHAVRMESERRPDGTLLVHNYGHGGAGITVSWGCARDAAALVARDRGI
ncbi:FAD-dependent oxidoreductase [Wenjunlia tyrosinilytica]|uniref:D-amino-acid oxidase n=1 Tax=Wenjunlia tyrosinilytica TaxID=1544741 RepID=A0A917ZVA3_9ACTN|nr:FAD-dependent oxidoreductase [Wenjunlia tyrosinilytica]GGO94923.1 amino acid oxidase [Wenjunlia tyrosinilytica]